MFNLNNDPEKNSDLISILLRKHENDLLRDQDDEWPPSPPKLKSSKYSINHSSDAHLQKASYKSIIPDNDTISWEDQSPSGSKTKLNTEREPAILLEMESPSKYIPQVVVSNKLIGVYKGKFGILTNKFVMPTKTELYK